MKCDWLRKKEIEAKPLITKENNHKNQRQTANLGEVHRWSI